MISYEVPLGFAVIGVMMMAGTASMVGIVEAQRTAGVWYVLPQILGFFCYFIAAIAETNRVPFDLPEAEAELVAGFHTEYSGMKFAFFFLAEYTIMIVVSSIVTILFFGGWLRPFPNVASLQWLENGWLVLLPLTLGAFAGWLFGLKTGRGLKPMAAGAVIGLVGGIALAVLDVGGLSGLRVPMVSGAFWFFLKVSIFLFLYIWLRGTYPRFRGVPRLRYHPESGEELCIACHLCETVCPDDCIHIVSEKKPDGKGKRLVSFEINYERCCFCGLCVDPCPTKPLTAIYMSHDYEMADYKREPFVAPLRILLNGVDPKDYKE